MYQPNIYQSLFARSLPATSRLPRRIIVTTSSKSVRFVYSENDPCLCELSGNAAMVEAIRLTAQRLHWKGTYVVGSAFDGLVAVRQDSSNTFTL